MPRTRWGTELRRARIAAGLSLGDVARLAGVSRSTVSRAEDDNIDTGISTYETLAQICGIALHPEHPNPTQRTDDPAPPDTYPNPRHDDPWDNDTVQWLLTHDRVLDAGWTRQILLECLRQQSHRIVNEPHRVRQAANLAHAYDVKQVEVHDPKIGKTIIRLERTDPEAPPYPHRAHA